MKNTIFTGAGVAIITPMLEDGSVDYAGLAKNIDFQIENGTDAIIICGTTGESSTLDDKEHRECIRFAVEHTHNRIPVIAGTGSNDTKYAIELSQEAQELGANGLLIVTPYYNKTTQRGLVAHYNAIADSVDLPIILYNVPSRTGVGFMSAPLQHWQSTRTLQQSRKPAEILAIPQRLLQSAAIRSTSTAATMI